jgi:hypothetical protein
MSHLQKSKYINYYDGKEIHTSCDVPSHQGRAMLLQKLTSGTDFEF